MIVMQPRARLSRLLTNISIHEISEITGFKSLTLQYIKEETIKDCQLTKLKIYIVDGFPKHQHECAEDIHSFFDYRESLAIIDGMVMKDKRIVIPGSLCNDALAVLHRSHMGIREVFCEHGVP